MKEGKGVSVRLLNYKKDGTPFWNFLSIGTGSHRYRFSCTGILLSSCAAYLFRATLSRPAAPVKLSTGEVTKYIGVQVGGETAQEKLANSPSTMLLEFLVIVRARSPPPTRSM